MASRNTLVRPSASEIWFADPGGNQSVVRAMTVGVQTRILSGGTERSIGGTRSNTTRTCDAPLGPATGVTSLTVVAAQASALTMSISPGESRGLSTEAAASFGS